MPQSLLLCLRKTEALPLRSVYKASVKMKQAMKDSEEKEKVMAEMLSTGDILPAFVDALWYEPCAHSQWVTLMISKKEYARCCSSSCAIVAVDIGLLGNACTSTFFRWSTALFTMVIDV